ncbi:uncharacterized protein RMCB_3088 [Mycolicibacterium brisbanense]|uniref:Uncharacterized protein n=1 Tax=Mycolicibacterium brisbanense TaxID=146020 RepID=A0A100VZS2_9MYCO|nr:uncharacterized protein RMCB_3088 [Mycolicibacterium brisbanense]
MLRAVASSSEHNPLDMDTLRTRIGSTRDTLVFAVTDFGGDEIIVITHGSDHTIVARDQRKDVMPRVTDQRFGQRVVDIRSNVGVMVTALYGAIETRIRVIQAAHRLGEKPRLKVRPNNNRYTLLYVDARRRIPLIA